MTEATLRCARAARDGVLPGTHPATQRPVAGARRCR